MGFAGLSGISFSSDQLLSFEWCTLSGISMLHCKLLKLSLTTRVDLLNPELLVVAMGFYKFYCLIIIGLAILVCFLGCQMAAISSSASSKNFSYFEHDREPEVFSKSCASSVFENKLDLSSLLLLVS